MNKYSMLRYKVLDSCFRNRRKRYYIDDLVDACNDALYDAYNVGVSERQVREDIRYMESDLGYSAPIERGRDGHCVYYRYRDSNFSIIDMPLSQREMELLTDTISMLSRFKGMTTYNWINETIAKLNEVFQFDEHAVGAVSFSQVENLKGLEFFSPLFDAIVNKQTVLLNYKPYNKKVRERVVYPYQLRQYNNRWFLVGHEPRVREHINIMVYALDRIESFQLQPDVVYEDYDGSDLDEVFKDIVGVSVPQGGTMQKIILKAKSTAADYIKTKPFHRSQVILEEDEDYTIFELNVMVNYEIETQLITFLHECEIIEPIYLRKKLVERACQIIKNNP